MTTWANLSRLPNCRRIRALMRRSYMLAESVLAVDDLELDRVERRVQRAGRRIEPTSKEFCLLESSCAMPDGVPPGP